MKEKIKIRISEKAYEILLKELKKNDEYSHLRLSQGNGCCKSAKVDLVLDNPTLDDIVDTVEDISFVYDECLLNSFCEVIIVYRNSSLMIKTVSVKRPTSPESSTHCNSHSCGCSGGGCRHKNTPKV